MDELVIRPARRDRFSYRPEVCQRIAATLTLFTPEDTNGISVMLSHGEQVSITFAVESKAMRGLRFLRAPEVWVLVRVLLSPERPVYHGGETGTVVLEVLDELSSYPFDTPIHVGMPFTMTSEQGWMASGTITAIDG